MGFLDSYLSTTLGQVGFFLRGLCSALHAGGLLTLSLPMEVNNEYVHILAKSIRRLAYLRNEWMKMEGKMQN